MAQQNEPRDKGGGGKTDVRAALAGVVAAAGVFAVATGLTYPLLALVLERQGEPPGLIGVNAAMTPVGMIVTAPLLPAVARRCGAAATAVGSLLLVAASLAFMGAVPSVWVWFPARLLLGAGLCGAFTLSESWLMQLAEQGDRGRVMGLYATVISTGFVVGPLALSLIADAGPLPFAIGVGAAVAAALTLAAVRRRLPELGAEGERRSVRAFLPLAPTLLLAVGGAAAFEQAVLSFLPAYGMAAGLAPAAATGALAALIAGNIVAQVPLGWLADAFGRRPVMVGCAVTALACNLLLPWGIVAEWWRWPLLLLCGAAAFGVYTVALTELGDRFKGATLLAGSAAFTLTWGLGGVVGPVAAGVGVEAAGQAGLPLVLAACFAPLLLSAASRARRAAAAQPGGSSG